MNNYKELKVWKQAIDLGVEVYSITNSFPDSEKFGLVSQIRRATISISSNIAEGAGRNNKNEFYHFLGIAYASALEVESQLIISNKIGFLNENNLTVLLGIIEEICKMIYGLKKSIKN